MIFNNFITCISIFLYLNTHRQIDALCNNIVAWVGHSVLSQVKSDQQLSYILEYKPTWSTRLMVLYLGYKMIIRRTTQTMDGPAQFFSEENAKHYNQKSSLRSMHLLFCSHSGKKLTQPIPRSFC